MFVFVLSFRRNCHMKWESGECQHTKCGSWGKTRW